MSVVKPALTLASAASYEGDAGVRRYREDLEAWVGANHDVFAARESGADLAAEVKRTRHNQAVLYEAGWSRFGWPATAGGFGGSPMLRAVFGEVAIRADLLADSVYAMTEVLTPTVVASSPEMAGGFAARFISGQEGWCQGFSEPNAGSDLASLQCRAVDEGDHWIVSGQKIWTSFAQFADRIVVLARTGTKESRHRGITAMLIDMDAPGVRVNPIHGLNDEDEFSETFFDNVHVPKSRMIGEENGGWAVAMNILQCERGAIFWTQSAWLLRQLGELVEEAGPGALDPRAVGHAYMSIAALRARSWTTQHRLQAGTITIPESSIDKILMATAEQELFDTSLDALGGLIELSDADNARAWRSRYMYSRAASIYGGTAQVQRNIVADQILKLGRGDR